MSETVLTPEVPTTQTKPNWISVIEIQYPDGRRERPVMISMSDPNCKEQLADASVYFRDKYKEKAIIAIVSADYPEQLEADPKKITTWTSFRGRLLDYDTEDNAQRVLNDLKLAGVPVVIVQAIEQNIQSEANETLFRSLLEAKVGEEDRKGILKALEIAKRAHKGQAYAKEGEVGGLDNVPYVNHAVVVATLVLKAGLSPVAVQVAILHDVVEDTEMTFEDLKAEGIDPKVIEALHDLTKNEGESREAYLKRSKELKGESKVVKCFDRFDNLTRAFTRKKPEYHARYIGESKTYFYDAFLETSELEPYAMRFDLMLKELEKYREKLID